uniref:Uncharacterized protein n=1 Tax=Onchocerca volvulus TaxID=6282 RepID=A0A8R1XWP7_ONCVO
MKSNKQTGLCAVNIDPIIVNKFQIFLLFLLANSLFQQNVLAKLRFAYISVTKEPKVRQIKPWENKLLATICGKVYLFFYCTKNYLK